MAGAPVIWKKRILIPFWVVRILCMLFIIAIYAVALKVIADDPNRTTPAIGVVVVFMLLIIAVLLMDVLAILMFLRDKLNPKSFLIMNVIQTAFWFVVLILDIAAIARGASAAGIAFTIFVLLSFLALLIYASVNFHRQRKAARLGHYAPAHNPHQPPAFQQQHGTAVYGGGETPWPQNGVPQYHQHTEYQSPAQSYKESAYYSNTGAPAAVELHAPYTQYSNNASATTVGGYGGPGAAGDYYQGHSVQAKPMV
ncbi:hypothetical protein BDV96DRAFT_500843 [Lophiotrema nucula]|uniref:MARVEL domain-containing protein n=1 Tax=Lophiotrema nucula TaxID=690887 RepID=A0A6A5YUG3_9PLEO|nr:hypothetical protein BDV96DRAFT_500843 [Lophiotrema nucula]